MKQLLFVGAMIFALSINYASAQDYEPGQELGESNEGGEGGENDPPSVPEPEECCPGENLLGNGTFNSSLPNFFSFASFSSDYTQKTSWSGIFANGSYGHFMPNNSNWIHNTVCVDWNVHDQDYCGNQFDGGYLLVNGLTNGYGYKTVFEFDMTLEQGVYNLCADFRYLRDKCFDYWGPDLIFKVTGSSTTQKIFNVNTTASAPCDWQTEIMNFAVNNSSETVTISLIQNADRYTDGNDFAMDNITLKRIENVNSENVSFTTLTTPNGNGTYNINCTLQNPLEDPCSYLWTWCEWDGSNCIGPVGSSISNSSIQLTGIASNTTIRVVCTVQCPCGLATSHHATPETGPGGRIAMASSEFKPGEVIGMETINLNQASETGKVPGKNSEGFSESTFDIFPNPNNGEFTIHTNDISLENAEVRIYAPDGKKIFHSDVRINHGNDIPLQLQELPSGVYKVILSNNQTRQQSSLVIK
ncbi:MAG TPA: hypothetical protein DIU20_11840 [Cryomorphaceae bacterium]|nr:hypothetical protein [Owenweeksia sp.]HCQ16949.1 hypothetical protein [Cryomorphaceae bacterium]|tara:strand:+ start:929 stop:2344 length:1416 start_codon:yes stop_codon:yes gene_type:complete